MLNWFVFSGLASLGFAGVTIASTIWGYRLGKEAAAAQSQEWRRLAVQFFCPGLLVFLVAVFPWNLSSAEHVMIAILTAVPACFFLATTFIEPKEEKKNNPTVFIDSMITFCLMMSLVFSAWTFVGLINYLSQRRKTDNSFFRSSEYVGPSRIVAIVDDSGGEDDGEDEENDDGGGGSSSGVYDIQIEWKCQEGTKCQYEIESTTCSNVPNLDFQPFYWDGFRYRFAAYNMNGVDCDDFSSIIPSDYDADVSPQKDGSPYIDILANCTSCTAFPLARESSRPRGYAFRASFFGFCAIISGLVVAGLMRKRRRNWSADAAVELVPADSTVS